MIDASVTATTYFTASTVIAASIGAIAIVVAAIVGTWPSRRATSYEQYLKDLRQIVHDEVTGAVRKESTRLKRHLDRLIRHLDETE